MYTPAGAPAHMMRKERHRSCGSAGNLSRAEMAGGKHHTPPHGGTHPAHNSEAPLPREGCDTHHTTRVTGHAHQTESRARDWLLEPYG